MSYKILLGFFGCKNIGRSAEVCCVLIISGCVGSPRTSERLGVLGLRSFAATWPSQQYSQAWPELMSTGPGDKQITIVPTWVILAFSWRSAGCMLTNLCTLATCGTVLFSETEQLRIMTRRIDRSALISSRMSRRGCSVERLIHMRNILTSADGGRQGFAPLPTDTPPINTQRRSRLSR
jgi:hypothetical protein